MITLTHREWDVVHLKCRGLTSDQIAEYLGISPRTVHQHIKHINRKTGARSFLHAVAIVRGLTSEPFTDGNPISTSVYSAI